MHEPATAIRIRVECNVYAPDAELPIRLLVIDTDDTVLTELKFTPDRARETAYSVGRLLGNFVSLAESHKLAQGLRSAAVKVWATRN